MSTLAFKQCSSKGECFCGAAGHTPECPDLVAGLAAPAMQVHISNTQKYTNAQKHKNKLITFLCKGSLSCPDGAHTGAVPRYSWSLLDSPYLTSSFISTCAIKGCTLVLLKSPHPFLTDTLSFILQLRLIPSYGFGQLALGIRKLIDMKLLHPIFHTPHPIVDSPLSENLQKIC